MTNLDSAKSCEIIIYSECKMFQFDNVIVAPKCCEMTFY